MTEKFKRVAQEHGAQGNEDEFNGVLRNAGEANRHAFLMRGVVGWVVLTILCAFGLLFLAFALADACMLISGLLTGVLIRPVLMGPLEVVRVSRSTDPNLFWNNEGFWAFFGLISASISVPLIAPLSFTAFGMLAKSRAS